MRTCLRDCYREEKLLYSRDSRERARRQLCNSDEGQPFRNGIICPYIPEEMYVDNNASKIPLGAMGCNNRSNGAMVDWLDV